MRKPGRPKKDASKLAKTPRQGRLPQMEDAKIEAIETAAENYAEIRDQRQELTTEEVKLKTKLLTLMKEHKKKKYIHAGISVEIQIEKETVRVRVKKESEADG